jgi:two-component system sensor histidine kinase UhpB
VTTTPGRAGGPRPATSPRNPWADSRFWLLQLVVLALALIRLAVTVAFHLDATSIGVEFSTLAIFVVPVVVAALNDGLVGGLATATWIAVLSVPRFVDASGRGKSSALWAEALQMVVLFGLALLVGQRVTSEANARQEAEASLAARLRAEALYQDIFESNQSPILIIDADGFVIRANPSADRAFRSFGTPGAAGRRLVDVVGAEASAPVLGALVSTDVPPGGSSDGPPTGTVDGPAGDRRDPDADGRVAPVAFEVDGESVLYRPTATLVGPLGGDRRMQVIFEDVTAETRRHDLLEAYANQVVVGQEEERRHIAQELHDGPLQALVHLCRQIDVLDARGGAAPSPDGSLASMRTTVEDTVAELRSIARGLRPSILDDLGLVASINQVVVEATGRQGLTGEFLVAGTERRLPPAVELAVFRIAQEAVTNVERHASARNLAVALDFDDAGVRLLVEDDGVGFSRDGAGIAGDGHSLGLPGMHERARQAGGRLVVRSRPGHGTTVEARVPVPAPEPA